MFPRGHQSALSYAPLNLLSDLQLVGSIGMHSISLIIVGRVWVVFTQPQVGLVRVTARTITVIVMIL